MSSLGDIMIGMTDVIDSFLDYIGFKSMTKSGKSGQSKSSLSFHNTLSGEKEPFTTLQPGIVKMYNCGPTAYDVAHIGNLCSYLFADTVRRTLEYNGYEVKQVINITDFGHLSSDGDLGDDKMSKALKREGKKFTLENMRILAEKYTEIFIRDLSTLNIATSKIQFPRASDFIPGQIAIIRTLEEKGYTYKGKEGVYFDTSRFPAYGKLGNINLEGLKEGARVASSESRKNPTDFLLWKFDPKLGWDSPWGKGFPGWHIECSAMIRETLGWQIDIHTGGIDLMPTHHNNEIAQSESASGKKPFSRFWLHHAFLNIKDEKISKSVGNIVNLATLIEKGYHPLALRCLWLMSHYRSPSNFTWDALEAAQSAYLKLKRLADALPHGGSIPLDYKKRFEERVDDDLDTPGALAVLWEMVKDKNLAEKNLRAGLIDFDTVFGLGLEKEDADARRLYEKEFGVTVSTSDIPLHIQTLLAERETARAEKRWNDADAAREKIEYAGYVIEDTVDGPRVVKKGNV